MKVFIFTVFICLLIFSTSSEAFRMDKPTTFTYPLDEKQIDEMNDLFTLIWHIQNGRVSLDVSSTQRTSPDNGDIWLTQTGNTVYINYRANNHTFTVTPNGF